MKGELQFLSGATRMIDLAEPLTELIEIRPARKKLTWVDWVCGTPQYDPPPGVRFKLMWQIPGLFACYQQCDPSSGSPVDGRVGL